MKNKIVILGGGLSGISASFHLGHENCIVYEKNQYLGGHIYSEVIDGFTWDEGPHVSFTKNEYVRNLFAENVDLKFEEYPVETANFFEGNWIPHPAQSNLWAVPVPLNLECYESFIQSRNSKQDSNNYEDWCKLAFGEVFYENFPKKYTKKYWTLDPKFMTTDWVGDRVYYPEIDEVKNGLVASLDKQTHYITHVRYPSQGGYLSYVNKIKSGINVLLKYELESISFKEKLIRFKHGEEVSYQRLISTLPLPLLISRSDAPNEVKDAAAKLSCTSVLIVNISVNHITQKSYNWIYVYDEDKYSTRINFTELLSKNNAPLGHSGIQVEVYFSKYKPFLESTEIIVERVKQECIEMGLIKNEHSIINTNFNIVEWANVLFDHERQSALNTVLDFLNTHGLERNDQDLLAFTNWENYESQTGDIELVGRFAEWKYYWTDDCVLRSLKLK